MRDHTVYMTTGDEVLRTHGQRLRTLIGQPMVASWVAWDLAHDTWFGDEAVIMQIGSERIELVWRNLDALALTWNCIDLSQPVAWLSEWRDMGFNLAWCQDVLPVFHPVVGKILTDITLVEYQLQTQISYSTDNPAAVDPRSGAWVFNGLAFWFGDYHLRVFNALDENGVTNTPANGSEFRSTRV